MPSGSGRGCCSAWTTSWTFTPRASGERMPGTSAPTSATRWCGTWPAGSDPRSSFTTTRGRAPCARRRWDRRDHGGDRKSAGAQLAERHRAAVLDRSVPFRTMLTELETAAERFEDGDAREAFLASSRPRAVRAGQRNSEETTISFLTSSPNSETPPASVGCGCTTDPSQSAPRTPGAHPSMRGRTRSFVLGRPDPGEPRGVHGKMVCIAESASPRSSRTAA